MCGSMIDIQSAMAEIRRGNKNRRTETEETTGKNMMSASATQGGHKKAASPLHVHGRTVFARWRQCAPHLTHASLGPTKSTAKRHLKWFSHFCAAHGSAFQYFTMNHLYPLKIARSHMGSGPPSNTWFLGPTRVLNPNCISFGSAVLSGLTSVTDRQTYHALGLQQ